MKRRKSHIVLVGAVAIGGDEPIVVQSMTNTDTADVESTAYQVMRLADAGSEIVRITVDNEASASCVADIRAKLDENGYDVPLVGDFHYNGHTLLDKYPDCAKTLDKYRINPGNVGFGAKRDEQFQAMIEAAIKYDKPVRIGVNWGSLDQNMLAKMMNENSGANQTTDEIKRKALIASALESASMAEKFGLASDKIIISCKTSLVQDLIAVYQSLGEVCEYPLHLGLTEAGIGDKGIIASTAALSVLLQSGIGDTIRVSITPKLDEPRTKEVEISQNILQVMGIRSFSPQVASCPGCGRTTSVVFQELAEKTQDFLSRKNREWKKQYIGISDMNVAVMGCIVNGPGESKHANIGISLPGNGESPVMPVFIDGKKAITLRGENITDEFFQIIEKYVSETYKRKSA